MNSNIMSSYPMIKNIARNLASRAPSFIDEEDLAQTGIIGVIEKAGEYKGLNGASFLTYARHRSRGAMLDDLRGANWASQPSQRKFSKESKAVRRLEQEKGRTPRMKEIAEVLGIDVNEHQKMQSEKNLAQLESYEAERGDSELAFKDRIENPEMTPEIFLEQKRLLQALPKHVNLLPKREKYVIKEFYINEVSLADIGQCLGVSVSMVSLIRRNGVDILRKTMEEWAA